MTQQLKRLSFQIHSQLYDLGVDYLVSKLSSPLYLIFWLINTITSYIRRGEQKRETEKILEIISSSSKRLGQKFLKKIELTTEMQISVKVTKDSCTLTLDFQMYMYNKHVIVYYGIYLHIQQRPETVSGWAYLHL